MTRSAATERTCSDAPHVFFCEEPARCDGCGARVEARTVLRRREVVRLIFCPVCGASEERVADDPAAFVDAFLARITSDPRPQRFKETTSTCAGCLDLVTADVIVEAGKVFFDKVCACCGPSRALVSEDAAYYLKAYTFARGGCHPKGSATQVAQGCPMDCGLCPDHEQHTCLPVIEVTDYCNLTCPICIVNNEHAAHLPVEQFRAMLDRLVASEGRLESVALSGGEPTSHPAILALVDAATRPEIGRVVVLTNGLRIARDRPFAEALKARGAYVSLQLDGFSASASVLLRGRNLLAEKEQALSVLRDLDIPTQLVFVAARGVNEGDLGAVVDRFLACEHILSLNIQPIAHTGQGGGNFRVNPLDRLTIPGVLRALETQTNGVLRASDFQPLPCPSPHCVSLTYLLRMADGTFVPFPRFADLKKHDNLLRTTATLPALPDVECAMRDVVYELFAREAEIDRASDVLAALRRTLATMFPDRPLDFAQVLRIGERQVKSIFIHHYMDPHDFDLERLRKCCHHYPQPDGRVLPMCSHNLFFRGAAKGPGTGPAAWAPMVQR